MADNKCNYEIKGKYNGVYGYTNSDLTDKKAEKLVKEHARGYDLFAVLPVAIQKDIDDKLAIEKKAIEALKSKKRESMLDNQKKAEDAAIKLMRDVAISKEELELKEKRKVRLNKLLTWDKERLVNKAKDIGITSTGSVEDLAKRIHKKEQ